ncbi:unnamed protein product [Clonostachys rhizophaga]|uniref:Uncharacterized protein n=1 Tax=Clonostachys rhizophaga TaxID=160324 RepID=A0A9N9VHR3_9HYPO|nr:unnamed protein product [Clonostachys rhizophaga]
MDSAALSDLKEVSKLIRDNVDERLDQGLEMAVVDSFASHIRALTTHFTQTPDLVHDRLKIHLHDAWYTCIQAAKIIDSCDNLQEVIVSQLLAVRTLGPLQPVAGETASITFSDGYTLWSGLPLFAQDLAQEFASHHYKKGIFKREQQQNLAGFIGRLLSVGIYDGPAVCALSIFREALEVPRPLTQDPDSEEIPLEELLGLLGELINQTKYSLPILAGNHVAAPTTPSSYQHLSGLGELAIQAGNIPLSGYSPERWTFWLQRLMELSQCGVKNITDDAETFRSWLIEKQNMTGLLK